MSYDKTIPDFENLLSKPEINSIIEALIRDNAFSVEFVASCIANYYLTQLVSRYTTKPVEE